MPKTNTRILAIDPGTRLMGVAFLDDGKLVYHAVKVIARGRSPQETLQRAKGVILRLIDDLGAADHRRRKDVLQQEPQRRALERAVR